MARDRSITTSKADQAFWFWSNAIVARHGTDRADAYTGIHTIMNMTDWPLLRSRCAEMLSQPIEAAG